MNDFINYQYEINHLQRQGKISEETSRTLKSHYGLYDDYDVERKLRNEGVSYFDIDLVLNR